MSCCVLDPCRELWAGIEALAAGMVRFGGYRAFCAQTRVVVLLVQPLKSLLEPKDCPEEIMKMKVN